ncbi:shikimate dehydrogenase family protein [Roseomonas sp. CCTCC AB2023176]|uniref:shikimate dehydrogenase family protein n=1 Tax=Roseomonas sp. CCTCC AB2023176 TaxID=3342640 RepID=UPI0035D5F21E
MIQDWPTGRTRVIAILGDPVEQVKSPATLTTLLRARGDDAVVVPMRVAAADLPALLDALSRVPTLAGLVVTVPHKPAALAAAKTATPRARRAAAANTLRRMPGSTWHADMLDGEGFVAGLRATGFEPRGRRALMVGAGGVGGAIAVALMDAGLAALRVHDVDAARAAALAARLSAEGADVVATGPDPDGCDLIVNATPVGMSGDPRTPLDPAALSPGMSVAEVIMEPAVTPLLAAATRIGCRTHPGRLVLEHQLPLMAEALLPRSC